jgi:hypothetical protein
MHTVGLASRSNGLKVMGFDRPSGREPIHQKQHDGIMHLPDDKNLGRPLFPSWSNHHRNGVGIDESERVAEPSPQLCASVRMRDDGHGATCGDCGDLDGMFDDADRALERNCEECFGHMSRANARYHGGDAECEADYRAAFLVDSRLAATTIVQGLANEVREDVGHVLTNCMERLAIDSRDVVTRARLGLTLLLLYQDSEAFKNLQRAFLQNPSWRPFLRLLVNKVKMRRAKILPLILRRHQNACP